MGEQVSLFYLINLSKQSMYLFLYSMQRSLWFILPSFRRQYMYLFRRYHSRNHENTPFSLRSSSSPLVNIFFRSPRLMTTSLSMGYTSTSSSCTRIPTFWHRLVISRLYLVPRIYLIQHFTTLIVMFFWQSSLGYFFLLTIRVVVV